MDYLDLKIFDDVELKDSIFKGEITYYSRNAALEDNIIGVFDEDKNLYIRTERRIVPSAEGPVAMYFNVVVKITDDLGPSGEYAGTTVKRTGLCNRVESTKAIQDIALAMGIKMSNDEVLVNEFLNTISSDIEESIQDGLVDSVIELSEDGADFIWTYTKELVEGIYNSFNKNFPVIPNAEYYAKPKIYDDGTYYYDANFDFNLLANVAAELRYAYPTYTGDRIYNPIERGNRAANCILALANDFNNDLNRLNIHPKFARVQFGSDLNKYMTLTFYDFTENYFVVSGDGETIGATGNYRAIAYKCDYSITPNFSKTVVNAGSFSGTGLTFTTGNVIDTRLPYYPNDIDVVHTFTLSYDTGLKPYTLYDNFIYPDRNKTPKANYPNWIDDFTKVYPEPDIDPVQDIVWTGIIDTDYPVPQPVPPVPPPSRRKKDVPGPSLDIDLPTTVKGICSVYRLEDTQLTALTAELWDQSILTQVKEVFINNPMDAVISLHQVYFPVTNAASKDNIYLGNVRLNTEAWPVTQRYTKTPLGGIDIPRFYNDPRDYNIKVTLFLPFIGFQDINYNDVFDGKLNLTVITDSWTGDILYLVQCNRNGILDNKVLYQFSGNASVQIPLTSRDRTALIKSTLSAAPSIAGTIGSSIGKAFSGNIAGALGDISGVFGSTISNTINNAQANIQRNGSITGSIGAMGIKQPYVIIDYPQPYDASNYEKFYGKPTNTAVNIGSVSGFTVFKSVHVENIPNATDIEKDNIENLLMNGVIL